MKFTSYLLLSALAIVLSACGSRNSADNNNEIAVKVQRVSFSNKSLPQVYMGRVEAGKTSLVTSAYPGRIMSINVRKGQNVAKGSILAVIDSPGIRSLYESSKASYDQAKDAMDRVNQVYSAGGMSAIKQVEVQTQYTKAESAYRAAERALEDCTIRAPYNGVVGDILLHEGTDILASEPIFRFLDVNTLEVHASIPENEYALYSIGQNAKVKVEAIGATISAVLVDKGFEASPLSHSYDFLYRITSGVGKLVPGMVCKVYMSSNSCRSAVIPSSAVRNDSEGRYVWCVGPDGAVIKKHILVGGFSGDGVVVESGLEEGDLLVTEGGRKISSGMKNIVVDESR